MSEGCVEKDKTREKRKEKREKKREMGKGKMKKERWSKMMIVKKSHDGTPKQQQTATAKQEETTTKANKEGANQQKQQNNTNKTPTKRSEDTSHKTQNGKREWEVSNVKYQSKSKIESTKCKT